MSVELKYPKEKYPKISVIVATLNRAKYIEKALDSLVSQNYPNIELLVMDAGSTDGTLDVLKKYEKHISFLRSHPDNGPSDAWNEGVERASGDLICFLNSDDFYQPDTFTKVGDAYIENPQVDMINVLSRGSKVNQDGTMSFGEAITPEQMHLARGRVNALCPNSRFFKKRIFEKYGKFVCDINGVMAFASDYEFITRISLYNPVNVTLNHIGYNYVGHEDSLTFNNNKYTKLRIYEQKIYYIEQLFKNHSQAMDALSRAQIWRTYRMAYQRTIIKNLVDKNYKLAWQNLCVGIKKFGPSFILNCLRFALSYKFRFSKVLKRFKPSPTYDSF